MLLKDYFPNLHKKYHELSFKGIAFNSKEVKRGYIFFAFKGNNTDGNLYIKDAIKNIGAKNLKDMGKTMGYLKEQYPGQIDFSKASIVVRDILEN